MAEMHSNDDIRVSEYDVIEPLVEVSVHPSSAVFSIDTWWYVSSYYYLKRNVFLYYINRFWIFYGHALERTQLVKITVREFLDDITEYNWMHNIVRWTDTCTSIFLYIKRVRLNWNFIVHDVQNATYSSHGAPCPTRDLFPWLNTRVKVQISVWTLCEYPKRHSSYP